MKQKGKMSGKKLKQMFVTYTFVLPDFIGLLVFIIIPIIYSFYMSLYDWNFANIKQFIGIQNYVTMFSDSEWWQSLGRTFKLTLLYVPALFILSILFAVLINYVKNEKAAGFVKTAFLLPYSITSVIASCLWMFLYMDRSGFINVFLKAFGLKGEKFLGSTSQAMVCIAVVLIWINLGYNIILYCFNSSFNVWIRICKNEFSGEKANVYSDHQYFDDSGIVYSCTFVYDM